MMNLGIKNIRHNFKDLHHYSMAKTDIETGGVPNPFQLGLRHMLLSLIPMMLLFLQGQLRQSFITITCTIEIGFLQILMNTAILNQEKVIHIKN